MQLMLEHKFILNFGCSSKCYVLTVVLVGSLLLADQPLPDHHLA